MELQQICDSVKLVAKQAGQFILNERKTFHPESIEYKGKNDLVSYVDKTAEKLIIEGLLGLIEGAGFIAEENTVSNRGEVYNWIIDPLDGTTNFIHGVPAFCVSIGLVRNNELILGVIYEPNFDEMFYAWEGSKAYLNNQVIEVSAVNELSQSLIATGFPYHNYDRMSEYMQVFDYCMRNTHGLRRWGSAAIDLAYVACGRFEAFYEYGLNPWDVAAGAFIVQQAGGKVSDFSGQNNFLFGKEIIATNDGIFETFKQVVYTCFEV